MSPTYPNKTHHSLPETGYLRLNQIVGDRKNNIPPLIPIGKSSWWVGVRKGIYPKPIKLGPRTTVWRAKDIFTFIERGYYIPEASEEMQDAC